MSVDPASRPASCREFVDNLKTESEFTPTPVGSDFDTAVTSLWHVLYQDAKGVMHMTQESSEGIRRVLIDGSLGPAEKIRLALSLQGPFEPAENFEQFRDAVHVPVAALAGEEDDRITMEMPALKAGEDGQSETHRPALAGPLIDLGLRRPSYDWLAWLTLFVLGAAAALIGYQLLPGLRWRWF